MSEEQKSKIQLPKSKMTNYSQIKAMFAIAKASLRSIMRSPSAVVFSLAFPLIFIVVFGFIGGGGMSILVGVSPDCDTANQVYAYMQTQPELVLIKAPDSVLEDKLRKGKISGIVDIKKSKNFDVAPWIVNLETSGSRKDGAEVITMAMNNAVDEANLSANGAIKQVATLQAQEMPGKPIKAIDFILPGMLGFSLLSTGVFGTAFVFFNLRSTLVLKRFFATPISRPYIVVGEAISRVTFATLTSSFIIILGHFAFGFTLVNGPLTFVAMLLLSFLGLFVFMGFGFVVSSLAPNESVIPVLANIITLPQFLMAGTFFSTDAFPSWLQPIPKLLPLTYLNDAMRKVASEGANFADISKDILVLGIWGVVVYAVAIKVFKWE